MMINLHRPNNTSIYSIHSNLDSFILYNEDDINEQVNEKEEEQDLSEQSNQTPNEEHNSQNPCNHEQKHMMNLNLKHFETWALMALVAKLVQE